MDKIRGEMRGSVQQVTKYTRLVLQGNIQVTDKDWGCYTQGVCWNSGVMG